MASEFVSYDRIPESTDQWSGELGELRKLDRLRLEAHVVDSIGALIVGRFGG